MWWIHARGACRREFSVTLAGWAGRPAALPGHALLRLKIQRHTVDAVALIGGRWAVVEDVAEMAAAAAAMHLGAGHAIAGVLRALPRAGDGIIEARPAGAAL